MFASKTILSALEAIENKYLAYKRTDESLVISWAVAEDNGIGIYTLAMQTDGSLKPGPAHLIPYDNTEELNSFGIQSDSDMLTRENAQDLLEYARRVSMLEPRGDPYPIAGYQYWVNGGNKFVRTEFYLSADDTDPTYVIEPNKMESYLRECITISHDKEKDSY